MAHALFALADKIEARVSAATARVEKITQAILAKAFRGELVPTEAELARQEGRDYEPASVLLDRIRAAQESTGANGHPRARRRRTKSANAQGGDGESEDGSTGSSEPTSPQVTHQAERPAPLDEADRDELLAVVREVFSSGGPRDRNQAIHDLASAIGHQRADGQIEKKLDNLIRTAVRRGILENTPDGLRLLCRQIADYDREFLIAQLTAGMGSGSWDRDDLIQAIARRLGFRRIGPVIRSMLKSAISGALRRGLLERDGQQVRKATGRG